MTGTLVWKLFYTVMAALLIMDVAAVVIAPGWVEAATINVPGDYPTINAAIAAATAGDTINVAAGPYTENVNVNKSLKLQGASSATVIVTAANPAASVFNVTASSVNISGFTVRGATGGGQAGIFLGAGVANCNISNNILTGNFDGIWLGSGSHHNTLTKNTLSGNYQGFEVYISNYNTFTNNNASSNNNYGFKIDSGDHNTYTNNTANSNAKYGFYVVTGDGGGATNSTFTNNTANLNTQYGIRINGGSGYTLTGNTFNLNVLAGLRLKDAITNLSIQDNNITNNPIGIDIDVSVADVTTWAVTYNNISGNTTYGISNTSIAGILNATNNWWGSNTGPGPVGPGTGDKVSINITYIPWAFQSKQVTMPAGSVALTTNKGILDQITYTNPNTLLPHLPVAASMPYGVIGFTIINLTPGDTVTITFTLLRRPPINLQFWKYLNGAWVNYTSLLGGLTDGDNTVTVTIKDGGPGDSDGQANGRIVDPGAFVILDSLPETTPYGSSLPTDPTPQTTAALSALTVKSAAVKSPTRVSAEVVNYSAGSANTKIMLYVDGAPVDSQDVTLAPGDTTTVNFDISKLQPGKHAVAVNDILAGDVTVSGLPVIFFVILIVSLALAVGIVVFFTRKKRSWE